MARSVFFGIATAGIALALTASIATPSLAMSFSDYDSAATKLGNRADVTQLFSGRLVAASKRRAEHAEALKEIRAGRSILPAFVDAPAQRQAQPDPQRPISLTLPF